VVKVPQKIKNNPQKLDGREYLPPKGGKEKKDPKGWDKGDDWKILNDIRNYPYIRNKIFQYSSKYRTSGPIRSRMFKY